MASSDWPMDAASRALLIAATEMTIFAAFDDYIQQRRVLRYQPDRHAYQYEKELEDFIHSRQPVPVNGETNNGESVEARAPRGPHDLPRRAARGPQRTLRHKDETTTPGGKES